MATRDIKTKLSLEGEAEYKKQLKEINSGLKVLSSEMQLVTEKYKGQANGVAALSAKNDVLNRQILSQKEKVETLKKALQESAQTYGESDERTKKWQISLNNAERDLLKLDDELKKNDKYLDEAKQSADGCAKSIDKFGKETKQAGNDVEETGKKSSRLADIFKGGLAAGLAANAISWLTSKAKELWSALWGLEEQTREYRLDLAHLETNAKKTGVSFDLVKEQMYNLTAVTGETDSSIEALSNLMQTGFNDTQMVDVVNELSGAIVAFPDTLKIESLADGLQETVATGKGVGQFGELLERSGISIETFNSAMADAKTKSERLDVALKYLSQTGMAEYSAAFNDGTAATIALAKAEAEYADTQAEVGESFIGLKTGWVKLKDAFFSFYNDLPKINDLWSEHSEVIESEAVPAVEDLKTSIDELNAEYETAKETVRSTLESIVGGWQAVAPTVAISAEEVAANLQSQLDYMLTYRDNLDALVSRQVPGVDMTALISSLSDGTTESAQILAGLKTATDAELSTIAQLYQQKGTAMDGFTDGVAAAQIGYDERLAAMVNDTAEAVADMDLATEAKTSAVNTINGYINGIRGRSAVLNLTMTQAAQSAMNAWKSALDEHSPSRKMMESGENTIKGAIIGVEAMRNDLSKAYSDAANMAQLSFNSVRPESFVRDSRQSVNHTGTIRVEGVSNSGELIGAYDIIVEQLRREARM